MNRQMLDRHSLPDTSRTEHLELILEMSAVGVWELDVLTGAAWRNEQHDRIFGYDRLLPEWSYDRFLEHVLPEDRAAVDERYGRALEASRPWSFECRIRRADGEVRWISATGRPIAGEGGKTVRLIGHVIDVTHVKRTEEHLRVLVDELNHRVRNTLTVVQAIAARSFRDHVGVAQARGDFMGRINALADAHSLLAERNWSEATFGEVVDKALMPYRKSRDSGGPARIVAAGPEIWLTAKHAVSLVMALNELATNATKHGALSVPGGQVELNWTALPIGTAGSGEAEGAGAAGERVDVTWRERGGPPPRRGERTGFGMTLLERVVPSDLDGRVDVVFDPAGLVCRIEFEARPLVTLAQTAE